MPEFINNNNFQGANIGNFANQLSDGEWQQATQYNTPLTQAEQFLTEARTEIFRLLDEQARTNPTATDVERLDYIARHTTPDFKQKVAEALKLAGKTYSDLFGQK